MTEAIAWFAYRDERIAARYGAPLHAPNDHGWLRRHRDRQYNDSIQKSELPGTEALAGLNGEALVDAARAWEKTDDARWETGADELLQALRRGMVRSYRSGDVPAGFWADSTLGEHARAGYRFDRDDIRRVVEGASSASGGDSVTAELIEAVPEAPVGMIEETEVSHSVQASGPEGGVMTMTSSSPDAPFKPRAEFSEKALRAWFLLRVHTWPKNQAFPSETTDLASARGFFDNVPRGVFRQVRQNNVPDDWFKPGPRRAPRN